ncbi:uncharacterized protein [Euwallacea similis]|uniref:uncharacterized protein n=1 Tax=Euwallacea similis TaxID=1736056 RepID=UPI00344C987A
MNSFEEYLLREYPNCLNNTLPNYVRCASPTNLQFAENAFRRTLNNSLELVYVGPYKWRKAPFCRWFVEYSLKSGEAIPNNSQERKNLFKKITDYKPANTVVVDKCIKEPNILAVIYGIKGGCTCARPNFDIASKRPLEWLLFETDFNKLCIKEEVE